MTEGNDTLKRIGRVIIIVLAIAFVLWLLWISMPVMIPFLVGILLAYLLFPLVLWLERILPPRGKETTARRAISVIIVFLLFAILLVVFIVYIGATIIAASSALIDRAPQMVDAFTAQAKEWMHWFTAKLPPDTIEKVQKAIADAGPAVSKFLQNFLVGSLAVIPASFPTVMGFVTLPFFLIFALINYERYGQYINNIFPAQTARHGTNLLKIFGDQMGRYLRFMIIVAIIEGVLVFLGMAILRVEFAAALGAVAALCQVIPIIGPFISAALILLVVFALNPSVILWALAVLVLAQIIVALAQGFVQEKHFPLDPAVVMVLMTVGGFIGSYLGIILALPVGATVWNIYKYFRDYAREKQITTGDA
jgi:predicted PurR-regulated permease PerM